MKLTRATILPLLPWMAGGLLILGIFLSCWSVSHARTVDATAAERIRVADSTIKANAKILTRSDTALVTDTLRLSKLVTRYRADTLWRHDTVRVAGDTSARLAIPLPTVRATDSTIRACVQLSDDCAAFRQSANATMVAQKAKIDALSSEIKAQSSIWRRCGIGIGYGATLSGGHVLAGPAIAASCRVWP